MVRLFATHRIDQSIGLAPWVESACAPSYTAAAVRLPMGGSLVAQQFGGDSGSIVGQSYVQGAHPPR